MRSDSKRRNGRSDRSAVSDHALEPNDATIHKGDGLVRNLHGWREVRIVKGIVKRIAKDDEAMSMMGAKYANAAAPEAGIAPWPITVWPVTVGAGSEAADHGASNQAAGKGGTKTTVVKATMAKPARLGGCGNGKRHPGWRLRLEAQRAGARGELHPDAPGPLAAAIEPVTPSAMRRPSRRRSLISGPARAARRRRLPRAGSRGP